MKNIFENLFVLELANNHWGKVDRGLKIINDYGRIAQFNNVKTAIKLQFRNVSQFIHPDFKDRQDIRYVKKTLDTQLSKSDYGLLVKEIQKLGCIPIATPFDEDSVNFCQALNIPIIKIASSDINDWPLIQKVATLKRPVIASTGGSSLKDIDDLVDFFEMKNIPLAINHCVSLYPTEDADLELNQIDFLKNRYPSHTIGFSTHEYHDWATSIVIAYAKGARLFERHIDINDGDHVVSPYCSLPDQIDKWFKAYKKAKLMCGSAASQKCLPKKKEIEYLDQLVRGVYAKRSLPKGHVLKTDDFNTDLYYSIPLQKGQLSCREIMADEKLLRAISKDAPIMIDSIDCDYSQNDELKSFYYQRGL